MPTPAKPVNVIKLEGKSHRTKKELKERENGEQALLTGIRLKEEDCVRDNPEAHKMFLRLKKLYVEIGKNDALYENIINRYCILHAECKEFEEKRDIFSEQLMQLHNEKLVLIANEELSSKEFYRLEIEMQKSINNLDKQIQAKRKMMFDIEKENVMTIASALRSIPKKTEKKSNALLEALNG